jgi:hypothetical protein
MESDEKSWYLLCEEVVSGLLAAELSICINCVVLTVLREVGLCGCAS